MTGEPAGSRRALYVEDSRINLTIRAGVPRLLPHVQLARAVARTLIVAGAPAPAAIGLTLSDDLELAELNARHMATQGPTDVLSFPTLPPTAFPVHPGQGAPGAGRVRVPRFVLPPGRRTELGDIVVSVERAIAQAATGQGGQTSDVRWDPREELLLLVIHGALHVCGWDHAAPDEGAAMRALERRLLRAPRSA